MAAKKKPKKSGARKKPQRRLTDKELFGMPLSKLQKLAIRDGQRQEKAKNSEIDMNTWLQMNHTCRACWAGCIMRFSQGMKHDDESEDEYSGWRHAVDELRSGYVGGALSALGRWGAASHPLNRDVADYDDDREQFWKDMKQLAKDLKEANL